MCNTHEVDALAFNDHFNPSIADTLFTLSADINLNLEYALVY